MNSWVCPLAAGLPQNIALECRQNHPMPVATTDKQQQNKLCLALLLPSQHIQLCAWGEVLPLKTSGAETVCELVLVLGMFELPAGAFEVTMPALFRICLKQIVFDWYKKENRLTKAPRQIKPSHCSPQHSSKGNNPLKRN